ncbi:hypothetical protein JTB14_004890 [Gonioctena quinquepunctata]|nr:hypothetical protein JTB14_004890 [Gonioctena quinquepunctata]
MKMSEKIGKPINVTISFSNEPSVHTDLFLQPVEINESIKVAVYRQLKVLNMKLLCSNLEVREDRRILKSPHDGKNGVGLSGAARKRLQYLIKSDPPAEEARVKSVEPVKKESNFDEGL